MQYRTACYRVSIQTRYGETEKTGKTKDFTCMLKVIYTTPTGEDFYVITREIGRYRGGGGEIINADTNELIARNDFSDYLCTLWPFVKVK
jgi:hypothetical protein